MQLIKCKVCGKKIAKRVKCPHCGVNNKLLYERVWFIVLVFVVVIGACWIAGSNSKKAISISSDANTNAKITIDETTELKTIEKEETKQEVKKDNIELVGGIKQVTFTRESITVYIQGVVKNNTDKPISNAEITFNLYDKNGNQIDTAMTKIEKIEANGTWKFKTMNIDSDKKVASYKLVEMTGD